jgi:hypothetical protein
METNHTPEYQHFLRCYGAWEKRQDIETMCDMEEALDAMQFPAMDMDAHRPEIIINRARAALKRAGR